MEASEGRGASLHPRCDQPATHVGNAWKVEPRTLLSDSPDHARHDGGHHQPSRLPHNAGAPDIEIVSTRSPASIANAQYEWHPERAPNLNGDAIVSVVVSKADHQAIVMKGGVKIGSASVYVHGNVVGAEAYVLESWDKTGQRWIKLHFSESGKGTMTRTNETEHFDAPAAFRRAVHTAMRPGSIIVVTPATLKAGLPGTNETVFDA